MKQSFLGRVAEFIKEQKMTAQGDRIIVGISGGGDSVCLLSVLCALREPLSISLYAVHVHHGIRGESADGDERFVRELCQSLSVPLCVYRYDIPQIAKSCGWSLEEAGRNCRYEAFEKECEKRKGTKIAVAHHQDDQAETVLMNLMRGSGLSGMAGIRAVRGRIIRPLLCVNKKEILQWLSERGLSFREDESNKETCFGRNRIRMELLPWMEDFHPRAAAHIVEAARLTGEAWDYIDGQAADFLLEFSRRAAGGQRVPCEKLLMLPPPVRKAALRRMVPGGLKDITEEHIKMAETLLEKQTGKQAVLPGGRFFYREYDWLFCVFQKGEEKKDDSDMKVEFSRFPKPPGEKFPENRYTKWFDCDKIEATALFRTRQTGDYILLPGGEKKDSKSIYDR